MSRETEAEIPLKGFAERRKPK
jgi:hypothetical protein